MGRQWSAWLEQQGIKTALDLKRADAKRVRAKMTVVGERIVRELNGVSCLPLELLPAVQKGITVSRSFGKLLSNKDEIRQALLRYVGRAGEKLRRGGLMAERITVFARTDRFNPSKPCYSRMHRRWSPKARGRPQGFHPPRRTRSRAGRIQAAPSW